MTTDSPGPRREAKDRWQRSESGEHYATGRWASGGRRDTDPRLVAAILTKHLRPRPAVPRILDAPCGTARLRGALEHEGAAYVGLDVSASMLTGAAGAGARRLVRGDLRRLPCRADSFDVVVCCRLLHHLNEEQPFLAAVEELVRVSTGLVVISFWDAASLPALRRRLAPGLFGRRPRGRVAHSKAFVRAAFERAGARVVDFRHSFRFLSQQTFAVAVKTNDDGSAR